MSHFIGNCYEIHLLIFCNTVVLKWGFGQPESQIVPWFYHLIRVKDLFSEQMLKIIPGYEIQR